MPPFAVADHINYTGRPVFYPGTYQDGNDQGTGKFGIYPPFCDNFYFVLMVSYYLEQGGDRSILNRTYNGYDLKTRLKKAFACYNIDEKTQLCVSDAEKYTVDWGFADSMKKTGSLLMASLLRYCAAIAMEKMCEENGCEKDYYRQTAQTIAENVKEVFYDAESGWLYSATGLCKQHDVWATAYAVYLGIIKEEKTYIALKKGYQEKTAVCHGQIRQILTTENASADSAWECAVCPIDEYQNGGYWATATGWYAGALWGYDPAIAQEIIGDFIAHTKKYAQIGTPFEWINADTTAFSGRNYGTSGVLPYVAYLNGKIH